MPPKRRAAVLEETIPAFGYVEENGPDTDEPLLIRRRLGSSTAAEIRSEVAGAPIIEPINIARGGTPELLFPPPRGATPYSEIPSPSGSGASTALYSAPASRAVSVRATPAPAIAVNAVTDGGAAAPVARVGDKESLIAGYTRVSLCHTLAADAVQRAKDAAAILDADHREQIIGMLRLAGLTNANATSRKLKRIPLKKAISIATKAEQWVYQQQAAAAKHAAKEARNCARKLSGRPKLSIAEKNRRYLAKYGVARGTKSDRSIRKYERKIAKMRGL